MKRVFLLALVLGVGCMGLNAQTSWSATSLDGNTYRNGNVGIGISTPSSWFTGKTFEMYDNRPILKLNSSDQLSTILFTNAQVNSSTHYGEFHFNHRYNETDPSLSTLSINSYPTPSILYLRSDGNVGIGTGNPDAELHIRSGASPELILQRGNSISNSATIRSYGTDKTRYSSIKMSYDRGIEFFPREQQRLDPDVLIDEYGNVGIGTTSPYYKLDVAGTIHTKEVKVDMTGWSDFVFHPTYNLRPLKEVNTYIQQNGHLPEIPTAKEVEENGISLGEMNAKLLQKIEELTLYTIEQEGKIETLIKGLESQSELIKEQNKRIEKFENLK